MVWRTATALGIAAGSDSRTTEPVLGAHDEQRAGQSGMAMAAVQDMAATGQAASEQLPDSVDGLLDRIFARIEGAAARCRTGADRAAGRALSRVPARAPDQGATC